MGSNSRQLAFGVVVSALVVACPTGAEAREIAYRPVTGCPPASDVTRSIDERAPEGRDAQITIVRTADGYRGELVLGHGDGGLTRAIDGKSCASVVDALSLVVALDGNADSNRAASPDGDAAPEASAGAVAVTAGGPNARDSDAVPAERTAERGWSFGLAVSLTSFVDGRVITGGSLFVDLAWNTRLLGARALRPSLRLSIGRTLPETVASESRADLSTHFQLTTASVEACPIGSSAFDGLLTAAVCARWDLGALDASAGGGPSETRLLDAIGAQVRVRLATAGRDTWRPVVELGGGALAPLARDRFHVLGDAPLVVPAALLTASLGVGVVFP